MVICIYPHTFTMILQVHVTCYVLCYIVREPQKNVKAISSAVIGANAHNERKLTNWNR